MRLDRVTDLLAAAEVQPAGFHQVAVDDGVEELVVDDVVDMVVDIVVAPARGERAAVAIMLAPFVFGVHCPFAPARTLTPLGPPIGMGGSAAFLLSFYTIVRTNHRLASTRHFSQELASP